MTLSEYQDEMRRTFAGIIEGNTKLAVLSLGIAGEAGEVADYVKKVVGHGHALDIAKLEKELGDVLWYTAAIAEQIGTTLEKVAAGNVAKLRARYPNGFSTEASINRKD
jgi:NTP pyrophosphatase (non-canonical NTP hydrolase)